MLQKPAISVKPQLESRKTKISYSSLIRLKGFKRNIVNGWSPEITSSEAEFELRLKYGWFHLKLYSIFQDLRQRSIETGFWGI